ncbi:MAG: diphthine synthase [Candidatus Diapherotrites archaeon]|nr:diphthine synthase [Candidatus Diapherotrites archaeon]
MFYLIGIGLKPGHITAEAVETLKKCDKIFAEEYTSQYCEGTLAELKKKIGRNKKIEILSRESVETGFDFSSDSAKKKKVALIVFGNPLTATTHVQLLIDAKEKKVETKVIPGISITNLISKSGLDEYRFGRTATVCYHAKNFEPDSFYEQIKQNQSIGLHTVCLLDIKNDEKEKRLMNCAEAIEVLEKIASGKNEKIGWSFVALLALGAENEKIIIGKENIEGAKEVKKLFPQSLIVCGKLTEKEKEALQVLHSGKLSNRIQKNRLEEKTEKYEMITAKALEKIKFAQELSEREKKIGEDFLGMAKNYFSDGKHFRGKGDFLTALASFSYAHAWLDAGVRAKIFYAEDDQLFTLP